MESYPRLPLGLELDPSTTEGKINLGLVAVSGAGPLVSSLIAAPTATATALGTGWVGSEIGGRGGRAVGRVAETFGAPKGTAATLGGAGELAGGLGAGIGGVKVLQALRGAATSPLERVVLDALARRAGASGAAAPAEAAAAKTVRAATASVSPGAQRSAQHARLMSFAKEAASKSSKLGEKIWMLLDEAGAPLRVLTPDQAGAAARAGQATTWVKNLWG